MVCIQWNDNWFSSDNQGFRVRPLRTRAEMETLSLRLEGPHGTYVTLEGPRDKIKTNGSSCFLSPDLLFLTD